jgi:peptidoglycan-associated lipoprotein
MGKRWLMAVAVAGVFACKTVPVDARQNDDGTRPGVVNDDRSPGNAEKRALRAKQDSIRVDEKVRQSCGDLPEAHFAFDSSSVGGDAAAKLDALARCFVSGPLKDKNLKLIGHTDPRGGPDYNLELGKERAQSVARYLTDKGVEPKRIDIASKGEAEASPNPEGWAQDRIVDVTVD